jgi:N-acetylneuraminic acid mutarotase
MLKVKVFKMSFIRGFFLSSIALLSLGSCTDDSESYTYGVWYSRSDFDGRARYRATSFTIGNKGYVCGGYTGRLYLQDLWEYDIEGNYWTERAGMPGEAKARTSATGFVVGSKGYITTGYYNSTATGVTSTDLQDTWEYDPATNEWTRKDDFPGAARSEAISFGIGDYGYVGTGYSATDNNTFMKDFYRFDPRADAGSQWETMNGFGGNKRRGGTAFVINNVAYIVTGVSNATNVYDFWKFDPSSATPWTELRPITNDDSDNDYDDDYDGIRRAYAVSFVIDGKGYIVTGDGKTDYWEYNPATDLWDNEDFTPFEGSSRAYAVSFSTGTRGFVATGLSGSYYLDDLWELNPYELEED